MNSRERVLMTLNHQEPDRVPFDLGGTRVTGIHRNAYQNLRAALGMTAEAPTIMDLNQQLALVEQDLLDRLHMDVMGIIPNPAGSFEPRWVNQEEYRCVYDEFQVGRRMPKDDGLYFDPFDFPLSGEITESDLDHFPWPDPTDPARFADMRHKALHIVEEQKRAVVFCTICAGIGEVYASMRGYSDFYLDLAGNPDLAKKFLDQILDIKLKYWEQVFNLAGDLADVVQEGDDLAGQQNLLISPRIYRSLIKPRQKELFNYIHSHSKAKIFFHSCGAVRPLIPDLIEVGVDILNPVQVSAAGMDAAALKQEFGKDLVFWGGGVDTQNILGSGTPQQVREEVKKRLQDLMPGGGFVFSTVHNVQSNVPPENLIAMWETLQEYGVYTK